MRIALLSDIHGNREAFDACMAHARAQGAERFVVLGDLVGYGADPGYVVDAVSAMQADGAIVILGNHDEAIFGAPDRMNEYARAAVEWTRAQLNESQKLFLQNLPRLVQEGERLYVHSEASAPAHWRYVTCEAEAERSFEATDARVIFCGHTHRPQLYNMSKGRPPSLFVPKGPMPAPLVPSRRWLAVLGSVGQPRDENPNAAYAVYDDALGALTFWRVGYDIETAAQKIKDAGLPAILSARLFIGR